MKGTRRWVRRYTVRWVRWYSTVGTVVRYGGYGTVGTSVRTHCTVPTLLTEKPKTQIPDDMTMIEVTMRVGSTIAVLGLAACHFRNL